MSKNDPAERTVRDIRRKTRKQYTAEENPATPDRAAQPVSQFAVTIPYNRHTGEFFTISHWEPSGSLRQCHRSGRCSRMPCPRRL